MTEYIRGKPVPYLKAWRLRKNMAQSELASAAGVTRGTMARAERGDEVVSFANIRKIAEALGISVDDLLERDPESDA
jgi:transcriptional regulator with XRE-family HTH domain